MQIGQRVSLANYNGTVRYMGPLNDTSDIWIGIEWDDASRGKHSGTYNGRLFFSCRTGSGSFLRASKIRFDPTQNLWDAVKAKYTDASVEDLNSLSLVSGISKPIEAVGFGKAAEHFKSLLNVNGLFLEKCHIDRIEIPPFQERLLAHMTSLDLSWNLLDNINQISFLLAKMPNLQILKLEGNQFQANSVLDSSSTIFPSAVTDISLSLTRLSWGQIGSVVSALCPRLEVLRLALNTLDDPAYPFAQDIKELDLHSNNITDIDQVVNNFPKVERMTLSNNAIRRIPVNDTASHSPLKHLNLANNALNCLQEIANLARYSKLRSLQFTLTFEDKQDVDSRLSLIRYLPQLTIINKTKVTQQEREDAAQMGQSMAQPHMISDNFLALTFVYRGTSVCKRVLKHQTVKQLKGSYARVFKLRPTGIPSLLYCDGQLTIELNDDLALLSYYDVSAQGTVTDSV